MLFRSTTPLHEAAKKGNIKLGKMLLEKKADIDAKDDSGLTALHVAAKNGVVDMIEE